MTWRSGKRAILQTGLRQRAILVGIVILVGLGLYLVMTDGIEPRLGACSKYSPICLR
jgi:hypothetical protein